MKNTRLTSILGSSLIACALSLGSLVATQSASAQSTAVAEVNIPFAFHTPTQTLPAGAYRVDRSGNLLILTSTDSKAAGFVLTHSAIKTQAPNHGYVVFERYGDTYYLEQIWTAGENTGIECPKGRAEKESMMAKNTTTAPSSVELALNAIPKH
jgi:hypothetical protein